MSKLKLTGIHHAFRSKKSNVSVLADIDLHVDQGEFVSIIGPSGSGKSTLFHIIGGLVQPTSGDVWLDGENVTGQKGLISYMPQQPALFPWRSIEENVALGNEVAGASRSTAIAKAREWLPKVGLGGYERELPHVLSGGMQQRVSFLRALLSPQELMCLDEPFGSLDALTRLDMQAWLINIWEQNKRSILFVTHSIEEALFLSDRIYVFSNKPATILEEVKVPFARPRREDVQQDPTFLALRQHIQGLLRREKTSYAGH
ncbi:ABC transporter ATP-binding protein [Paenibacillus qinlingensis]|uniref:ABC-type nitrate/sulfonate/bicarbonate transport system ATPase subunit n=1 Tax=Paenibacillus qinlingensis TaxID=1837343 RepID=A0ABU1NQN7_9BACL|nr:ABC transporter ATP-binding protein [Paenibacillus qinlingensis]MDR6549795.1 ABC-type nitrate/sulfonate/bicarbonate transport system ATPase subunit [Paenibacillus qinlingensis]